MTSQHDALRTAGELGQALAHGAPDEVVAAYRSQLGLARAEKAIQRALEGAPPLRPEQISYLRGVLDAYAEPTEAES